MKLEISREPVMEPERLREPVIEPERSREHVMEPERCIYTREPESAIFSQWDLKVQNYLNCKGLAPSIANMSGE